MTFSPPFKHRAALGILCGAHARPLLGSRLRSGSARSSGPGPAVPAIRGQQRHLVSRGPALGRLQTPAPAAPSPNSVSLRLGATPVPTPQAATSTESSGALRLPGPPEAARCRRVPARPHDPPAPAYLLLPLSGQLLLQEALSIPADNPPTPLPQCLFTSYLLPVPTPDITHIYPGGWARGGLIPPSIPDAPHPAWP